MLNRTLWWASEQPRVQQLITQSPLTRPVVDRFVAGDDLEAAIRTIKQLDSKGIGGILDLLGEGVQDPEGASVAADEYLSSIKRIQENGIDTTVSIKLTQLGLAFDKSACIDHLHRLATEAHGVGTGVEIDMEQSRFITDTIDVYRALRSEFSDLRLAIQAYMRRTPIDLQAMVELKPKIRLVKGAYAETPDIALQKRSEIDAQYAFLIEWLLANGTDPAFGTHDHRLLEHVEATAARLGVSKDDYEIQMLYGIRRDLQEGLAAGGYRVRCYVPFGSAWYPYLMRRIGERPANLRFFLRAVAGR